MWQDYDDGQAVTAWEGDVDDGAAKSRGPRRREAGGAAIRVAISARSLRCVLMIDDWGWWQGGAGFV